MRRPSVTSVFSVANPFHLPDPGPAGVRRDGVPFPPPNNRCGSWRALHRLRSDPTPPRIEPQRTRRTQRVDGSHDRFPISHGGHRQDGVPFHPPTTTLDLSTQDVERRKSPGDPPRPPCALGESFPPSRSRTPGHRQDGGPSTPDNKTGSWCASPTSPRFEPQRTRRTQRVNGSHDRFPISHGGHRQDGVPFPPPTTDADVGARGLLRVFA